MRLLSRRADDGERLSVVRTFDTVIDVADLLDDGQWIRGKSLDTFCPRGPWIVAADEIPGRHRDGDTGRRR